MNFIEQVHIFGLTNIHTFGPNISLISLMVNYAKPRLCLHVFCVTLSDNFFITLFVIHYMVRPLYFTFVVCIFTDVHENYDLTFR